MKKFLILVMALVLSLSLIACSSTSSDSDNEDSTEAEEEVVSSESDVESKPGGATLSDGTLENSQLDEDALTIVGIWENGDRYLAIRERALDEDMEYELFCLDIFCDVGTICASLDAPMDGIYKITKNDTTVLTVDDAGCIIVTDTHDCVEYISTEEIIYDPETDTITVSSYYDGEPAYTQVDDGRFEFEEGIFYDYQFVYYRSDSDIESADWDWYYEASPASYDPR